ncbi:MAG: hypothetical protein AABY22_03255 [Nanoarchaeota archaeon]
MQDTQLLCFQREANMKEDNSKKSILLSAELQEFIKLNHQFIEGILKRFDKSDIAIKQCEELCNYAIKISLITAKHVIELEKQISTLQHLHNTEHNVVVDKVPLLLEAGSKKKDYVN